MINHLFKLIWNRKKANFLMISGIFISFIVLFLVITSISYCVSNYFKPLGFSYQDVWILSMNWKNQEEPQMIETMKQIENILQSHPEVEDFSLSNSYIFMPTATSINELKYNNIEVECLSLLGGDRFPNVLDFDMVKGRWFDNSDNIADGGTIVINQKLEDKLFPNKDALGKTITTNEHEYKVIGVIGEFRNSGELSGSDPVMFRRLTIKDKTGIARLMRDSAFHRMLIKVRPGTGALFEAELIKQLSQIARDWILTMETMENARISARKQSMVLPIILSIICGFLIINVALGLFGVIWYNTNRRRSEIGLRRALGATANNIYHQILGEGLVLVTFGIVFGSLFALQFPLLNIIIFIDTGVYLLAFIISVILIYIIATACAFYPSWLAAKIQPAAALHNE